VKRYIGGVLLTCLLSVSQADLIKTEDGHQVTARHSGADAEEVHIDSLAARTVPPENPPPPGQHSAEYWERQGYADGSRGTGMKTALAAAGGCIGVPAGAFVGLLANGTAQACLFGMAAGGGAGCLGGREVGSLCQREAIGPTSDSAFSDAYRRGYQRGVRYSDGVPVAAGAGAVLVSVAVLIGLWILALRSAMMT
jgi:hypothetical protein